MRAFLTSITLAVSLALGGCTVGEILADAEAVARAVQQGAKIADDTLMRYSDAVCGSMATVNMEAQTVKALLAPAPGSKAAAAIQRANAALVGANAYCASYRTASGYGLVSKYLAIVKASKAAKAALADAKVAAGV